MQTREAVLSDASYIEPGDKLRRVKVTLTFTVNVDAYDREYPGDVRGVRELDWSIRQCVFDAIEGADIMPEGILSDVEMES